MKDIPKPHRAFRAELEIVAENGETDRQKYVFDHIPAHCLTNLYKLFINLIEFL